MLLETLRYLICACRAPPPLLSVFCFGFRVGYHRPKGFEGEAPPCHSCRCLSGESDLCQRSLLPGPAGGAPEGSWNLSYAPQKFVSWRLKLLRLFFRDSQRQGGRQPLAFLPSAASAGLELGNSPLSLSWLGPWKSQRSLRPLADQPCRRMPEGQEFLVHLHSRGVWISFGAHLTPTTLSKKRRGSRWRVYVTLGVWWRYGIWRMAHVWLGYGKGKEDGIEMGDREVSSCSILNWIDICGTQFNEFQAFRTKRGEAWES